MPECNTYTRHPHKAIRTFQMSQIQPAPRSFYTRQAIFLSIALTAVLLGFASYLVAEVTRLSKEAAHSNAIALSTLVASSNDPYATLEHSADLAAAWGSKFVEAGAAGHINAESGHGPWPGGK